MSSFPSLAPPPCSPQKEKTSSLIDREVLEAKEKEYNLWVCFTNREKDRKIMYQNKF